MAQVDYSKGDYRTVADRLRPAAAALVEAVAPAEGDVVVDVATGSGNVARLCAARGAEVLGVDLQLEQLLLARQDGGGVALVQGDAQALPVRDGVADAALSTFGVIFAPRPDDAVRELARVTRHGGTIGLTAWPSGGWQEQQSEVVCGALGQPTGTEHIARWGTADAVREHLAPVADDVEVRTGELVADFDSVDAWWEQRSATAPLLATARERLSSSDFEQLRATMTALVRQHNRVEDGRLVVRDPYLLAVARRR